MDKIVLYGLGMRFEKLVRKNYLVNKELKKYEIVGFIDKKLLLRINAHSYGFCLGWQCHFCQK